MKRKTTYKILVGIILYFFISIGYKLYKNSILSETCLTATFNTHFNNLSSLKINSIYDFDKVFNCQEWDELFIIDAHYYDRGIGYLTSGVLVPSYDRFEFLEGTSLVFFLKNNIIIDSTVLYQ